MTMGISDGWEKANIMPVFMKGDQGGVICSAWPSFSRMIVEQIFLEAISMLLKANNVIRNSQYGFARDKLSLSNLLVLCG